MELEPKVWGNCSKTENKEEKTVGYSGERGGEPQNDTVIKCENRVFGRSGGVIILGMEHHNALNVARQLFFAGIKPYGIIVHNGKLSRLKWSRYWKECHCVSSEKEGIELAIQKYKDVVKRLVIITCTDRFAKIVDENLKILSEYFICPGVNEQGKLSMMMEKMWQYNFAVEHCIPTAPTVAVTLDNIDDALRVIKEKILCPYILKPVVSAEGDKQDIRICSSESELERNIEEFQAKGYKSALIQHLIDYDYEILLTGACFTHKKDNMFILWKINRSYPPLKGTGCYRENILDLHMYEEANKIVQKLKKTGYHGLIDIELFYKNGQIILNEFNLRSSGCSFGGISKRYLYAYYYVMDALGFEINIPERPNIPIFAMTEYSDIKYPLYLKYSWRKWLSEFRNVDDYAYFHWDDPIPMILQYFKVLVCIVAKKKW